MKISRYIRLFVSIIVLLPTLTIAAPQAAYPFRSPQKAQQFQRLITELRCLVCQNENLADSNASLAKDLRGEVYQMVKSNKTDQDVRKYMAARYGDFILFKPPVNRITYLLWYGPIGFLIFAFLILLLIIRSQKKKKLRALSREESEKLRTLLDES